jgi:hypothetical protein
MAPEEASKLVRKKYLWLHTSEGNCRFKRNETKTDSVDKAVVHSVIAEEFHPNKGRKTLRIQEVNRYKFSLLSKIEDFVIQVLASVKLRGAGG